MIKYILFVILAVAFVLNFKVKAVAEFVLKKEITEKQEMAAKCVIYLVALACVIGIMVFCK